MADMISKTAAEYKSVSSDSSERCGTCSMFESPHGCSLVIGLISQLGVCKYWEKKK